MHQHLISGRGKTGTAKSIVFCYYKDTIRAMNRMFLEKVFSAERTQKYFDLYVNEEKSLKPLIE